MSERLGSRKMGQSQTCSDLAKICGSFELERMRAQAPKFSEKFRGLGSHSVEFLIFPKFIVLEAHVWVCCA